LFSFSLVGFELEYDIKKNIQACFFPWCLEIRKDKEKLLLLLFVYRSEILFESDFCKMWMLKEEILS
jgi:hypothetical protein